MYLLEPHGTKRYMPPELRHLKLIPFSKIVDRPYVLPTLGGVYFIFLRGGIRILETCSYFELGGHRPLVSWGRHHVYTGSTCNFRQRILTHCRGDAKSSEFRLTLLAMEQTCKAISRSKTVSCNVKGNISLTRWLRENAWVAIEPCERGWETAREREVILSYPCPLNIAHRRRHPFAKQITRWRQDKFPAGVRSRRLGVRYI